MSGIDSVLATNIDDVMADGGQLYAFRTAKHQTGLTLQGDGADTTFCYIIVNTVVPVITPSHQLLPETLQIQAPLSESQIVLVFRHYPPLLIC